MESLGFQFGPSAAGGLGLPPWDYVALTASDAVTDLFTFKTGGAAGTTVATVTIVYTDATHATLSTVTKV